MQETYLPVVGILVALVWAGVAYGISRWGSGTLNRFVLCPHKRTSATISTFCYTRNRWSSRVEKDVLRCSLLGDAPVTCDKSCLTQL